MLGANEISENAKLSPESYSWKSLMTRQIGMGEAESQDSYLHLISKYFLRHTLKFILRFPTLKMAAIKFLLGCTVLQLRIS